MARRQFQSVFDDVLVGSVTADLASIDDGNEVAQSVTVTGAALGDFCLVSCSIDSADLTLTATVPSANTVEIIAANNTGGAVDLGSATYKVVVLSARDDLF